MDIPVAEFDDFISKLDSSVYVKPAFNLDAKKGGINVSIFGDFSLPVKDAPTRVTVELTWPVADGKMEFLTEPIKPPPGYENFSMDPPSDEPSQNPPVNPVALARSEAAMKELNVTRDSSNTQPTPMVSSNQVTTDASTPPTSVSSKAGPNFISEPTPISQLTPWIGLMAILFVIATIYALRKK